MNTSMTEHEEAARRIARQILADEECQTEANRLYFKVMEIFRKETPSPAVGILTATHIIGAAITDDSAHPLYSPAIMRKIAEYLIGAGLNAYTRAAKPEEQAMLQ
jgi:hypothetical protein